MITLQSWKEAKQIQPRNRERSLVTYPASRSNGKADTLVAIGIGTMPVCLKREGPLTPTSVAMVTDITCEQLAILEMGSPTLGHHATSLTQSVWASSFSSVTQLSLSSLVCEERKGRGRGGEGRGGEGRGGEGRGWEGCK